MRKPIVVRNLSFKYAKATKPTLLDVSFEVERGDAIGLFGLNGAGKSTLINILASLIRNYHGSAAIFGMELRENNIIVRKKTAVLFQDILLDQEITGYQNLEIFAGINRIKDKRAKIIRTAKIFGIDGSLNLPVNQYSEGMKRRLELSRCFLSEKELVLLDEPMLSLDELARQKLLISLKELNSKKGINLIISSNDFRDLELLCNRIFFIENQRIKEYSVSAFRKKLESMKKGTNKNRDARLRA